MNKEILHIAVPSILSNLTVPLLGLVGTGITGHLGETAYIGAIALGTLFFNTIYWVFAFLRLGTSGLTAQAYGRRNKKEIAGILVQALTVGLLISLALILLKYPVELGVFAILDTTPEIKQYALIYIRILIWGAPAVLVLYAFYGWFIGVQNARYQMYIVIVMNVANILLSFFFVYILGMNIDGVAYATLLAQYTGVLLALGLWKYRYGKNRVDIKIWKESLEISVLKKFFNVNRDIFFRMICLVLVTFVFVYAGNEQGEVILAVNTLMMQLFYLFAFFLDGFAFSGEALVGKYMGQNNEAKVRKTVRYLFYWGTGIAVLFTVLYAAGGNLFLKWLTDDVAVIEASNPYFYWALITPLVSFTAFIWDGIMIGALATRYLLIAIAAATSIFFAVFFALSGKINNHMLWLAFILYLFMRGLIQTFYGKIRLKII